MNLMSKYIKKKSNAKSFYLCLYYFKLGHFKKKYYYKSSKQVSKNFGKSQKIVLKNFNLKLILPKLKLIASIIKKNRINHIYIMQNKNTVLAIEKPNSNQYFNNTAFYHINDKLNNFKHFNFIIKYCHL